MATPRRAIAFLRAVNVGGRIVTMAELKRIAMQLGLEDVSTFIASGNLVFSRPAGTTVAVETRLESALERDLGYAVATMVRSDEEVGMIASDPPFSSDERGSSSLYVGLIKRVPPAAAAARALTLQTDVDMLRIRRREIYWLARKNVAGASVSGAAIEKALQLPVTFRNINTLRRLAANYPTRARG
jgi:uncharacterized protein (DUF1697 family)